MIPWFLLCVEHSGLERSGKTANAIVKLRDGPAWRTMVGGDKHVDFQSSPTRSMVIG